MKHKFLYGIDPAYVQTVIDKHTADGYRLDILDQMNGHFWMCFDKPTEVSEPLVFGNKFLGVDDNGVKHYLLAPDQVPEVAASEFHGVDTYTQPSST